MDQTWCRGDATHMKSVVVAVVVAVLCSNCTSYTSDGEYSWLFCANGWVIYSYIYICIYVWMNLHIPQKRFQFRKIVISKVSLDNKRAASQQLQMEIMSSCICTCSWQICPMEERSSLNLWGAGGSGEVLKENPNPQRCSYIRVHCTQLRSWLR